MVNKELKEFIMTLTGTLILGKTARLPPPARTTDRDILRAIMEGEPGKKFITATIRTSV